MSGYKTIILKLASGSLLAQILSFSFIPVITRIYGPDAFALFAVWASIGGIIGATVSLKQEQYFLSRPESTWPQLIGRLVRIYMFATTAALFVFLTLYLLKDPQTAIGFLLSFVIGLTGNLITATGNIANIKERYSLLARARIFMSVALGSLQIVFGLLSNSFVSLLLGMAGAQIIYIAAIWIEMRHELPKSTHHQSLNATRSDILKSGASLVSSATLAVAMSFPTTALVLLGYKSEAGNVAILQRLLLFPVNLFGMPMSQAFVHYLKRNAAKKFNAGILFGAPLIISSLFYIGAMVLQETSSISFLLGSEWAHADSLVTSVSLIYASLLVRIVSANYFIVEEKQAALMVIDLACISLFGAIFAYSHLIEVNPLQFIFLLNACYLVYSTIPLLFLYKNRIARR